MSKEYSYLTPQESMDTLIKMSDLDRKKIILNCLRSCRYYGLRIEPSELFNEAVKRIMEDDRHIPINEDFGQAFSWICKSIAEGIATSNANKQFEQESELELSDDVEELASETPHSLESELVSAQREELAKARVLRLFNEFSQDEPIKRLLSAIMDGAKPRDIVLSMFGGNQTEYESTKKRLTRRIAKMQRDEEIQYEQD